MNQGWTYRDKITKSTAGKTVLQYYTEKYPHSTEKQWRERIDLGQIFINSDRSTADIILQKGQTLAYHRPPWVEPPVTLNWETIYEDEDILAIAKPSGLPVLPGGGFLEHTVLGQIKKLYPHNQPAPIHRLGRGTSGLLLLAKSSLARSSLSHQIRTNSKFTPNQERMEKIYLAKIKGNTISDNLTISQPIGKIPHPLLGYIYSATPTGKFAYSQCKVMQRQSDSTIVQVTILTGRPHQIRIHLAAAGYPLMGDPLYDVGGIPKIDSNAIALPGDCGYSLHAYRLTFIHPRNNTLMSLYCTPPPDLLFST